MRRNFFDDDSFRTALARVLGHPPALPDPAAPLVAHWLASPLGPLLAVADRSALYLLEFFDRRGLPGELRRLEAAAHCPIAIGRTEPLDSVATELEAYFAGRPTCFRTPVAQTGTPFTRRVWSALRQIPPGVTRSYQELATAIGQPTAVRAVARANGANQLAIVVPCHRLLGADGSLTGYGGGLWRKRWLIDHEREVDRRLRTAENPGP